MPTKTKIALFANKGSPQLAALKGLISEQGAEPLVFDIQLTGESQSGISVGEDRVAWDNVDFDDIQAVHIRCIAPNTLPALPPVLNIRLYNEWRTPYLLEQEINAATYSFFERLVAMGKMVINPLTSAYIDHNTKSQLFMKLRDWGFDAPATIATNDPSAAKRFIDDMGEVVVKPSIGVGSTRLVNQYDQKRLHEIIQCPVMMQERIRGHTIRVHIVGDSVVLALRIITDDQIDSRTDTKGFEYFKLPDEEEDKIVQANRKLGLHYAAWDILASEDGRYVYLDCNPGPYIMWIGPEFVRIVFNELARYMIVFARTGSLQEASSSVNRYLPV